MKFLSFSLISLSAILVTIFRQFSASHKTTATKLTFSPVCEVSDTNDNVDRGFGRLNIIGIDCAGPRAVFFVGGERPLFCVVQGSGGPTVT